MNYQVRHKSFFMEFVHNFNSLKSVVDFVRGSSFQAVKEFEIISLPTKIEDLEINSIELCKNGKWLLNNMVTAAVVEFNELVKDFDIFEYRNNFDEMELLNTIKNIDIPGLIELIDLWTNTIEKGESFEIIKKCENLKKAILTILTIA